MRRPGESQEEGEGGKARFQPGHGQSPRCRIRRGEHRPETIQRGAIGAVETLDADPRRLLRHAAVEELAPQRRLIPPAGDAGDGQALVVRGPAEQGAGGGGDGRLGGRVVQMMEAAETSMCSNGAPVLLKNLM